MIVLASASPRRRELLHVLLDEFEIQPAVGEECTPNAGDAASIVRSLALAKAREVAANRPSDLVIGADTVVELEGRILGKPANGEAAVEMLRQLSGKRHRVHTGLAVMRDGVELNDAVESTVCFRELSEAEIAAYVATGEPMDKAGAYAIQGKASLFIEGIEGDYFNIVGLPLYRLGGLLQQFGVELL